MTFAVLNKWSKRVLGSAAGKQSCGPIGLMHCRVPKKAFGSSLVLVYSCLFCNAVPSDTLLELYTVVTAGALV